MKEKKQELKILNEVGSYAMLDEELGNELTGKDSGIYIKDKENEDNDD